MSHPAVPPRIGVFVVLCVLIVGALLPVRTTIAVGREEPTTSDHDWRPEQIGTWDCQGVSTLEGSAVPYYGHLQIRWSLDGTRLILRFTEYHPLGKPFREEQYWDYVPLTGTHTRFITTDDGSYAVLVAQDQPTDTMQWEGSFVTSQGAVQYSESLTRISAEEYYWHGSMSLGVEELGYYALTCHKLSS